MEDLPKEIADKYFKTLINKTQVERPQKMEKNMQIAFVIYFYVQILDVNTVTVFMSFLHFCMAFILIHSLFNKSNKPETT